jgi:light-regulated signal transduction histidine kinase (bacteriophytochrome)
MKALDGISKRSRIALLIAGLIMITFFLVQSCVVFGVCENTYELDVFGYSCVVAFMPPFFMVVFEFLKKKEEVAKELNKKNIYLEHAAKIIRHDMHSGINTYLPRGIKSLQRRLSDEDIERLKIKSPMQLISDGLFHAQKVYAGVYEFTNLVKENASMSKNKLSIKEILSDYLKLTAYQQQVLLDDNLPELEVNEPLFCTAIDNLIRNGLKYNDSATKWVKVYSEENYLVVEDNGRGLSNEEFLKLSEPYTRKKNQKENGTGLGLNICVQILNEHRFSIIAEKTKTGTKLKIKIQND